jgi:hypothetical protein
MRATVAKEMFSVVDLSMTDPFIEPLWASTEEKVSNVINENSRICFIGSENNSRFFTVLLWLFPVDNKKTCRMLPI